MRLEPIILLSLFAFTNGINWERFRRLQQRVPAADSPLEERQAVIRPPSRTSARKQGRVNRLELNLQRYRDIQRRRLAETRSTIKPMSSRFANSGESGEVAQINKAIIARRIGSTNINQQIRNRNRNRGRPSRRRNRGKIATTKASTAKTKSTRRRQKQNTTTPPKTTTTTTTTKAPQTTVTDWKWNNAPVPDTFNVPKNARQNSFGVPPGGSGSFGVPPGGTGSFGVPPVAPTGFGVPPGGGGSFGGGFGVPPGGFGAPPEGGNGFGSFGQFAGDTGLLGTPENTAALQGKFDEGSNFGFGFPVGSGPQPLPKFEAPKTPIVQEPISFESPFRGRIVNEKGETEVEIRDNSIPLNRQRNANRAFIRNPSSRSSLFKEFDRLSTASPLDPTIIDFFDVIIGGGGLNAQARLIDKVIGIDRLLKLQQSPLLGPGIQAFQGWLAQAGSRLGSGFP